MCGIYKITNVVNGKFYIGKSIDIERRWKEHCTVPFYENSSRYDTYFYNAIRKYGVENFVLEVIEEASEDLLNDLEKYWISFYRSNNKNYGYNTTDGGDGVSGYWDKPVCAYDFNGNFIQQFKSLKEAERILSISSTGIFKCCHHKQRSAGGYQWAYVDDEHPGEYYNGHVTIQVYQYDLDGNFIQMFNSPTDVKRKLGISTVSQCCNGSIKTAGGFQWSTIYYDKLEKSIKNHRTTIVYQYDLNGNFIKEFSSIKEASEETGVPYANINSCVHNSSQLKAGNFLWSDIKSSHIEPYHNTRCKQVECFTEQGELVACYPSIRYASSHVGIKESNIGECCRGKRKRAGGYIWKYKE